MKASKIVLLIVILAFGSSVETAWHVRNEIGFGPSGCRVLGMPFRGPSFSFQEQRTETLDAAASIDVENGFGDVLIAAGEPGQVKISVRKVVFMPTEEKAREFASRIQLRAARAQGHLSIGTNRRDLEDTGMGARVGFETHLDLTVPPDTHVKVVNSHGQVSVADVASADIESSFDSIHAERVSGALNVQSRHADVVLSFVKGAVKLTSRHGDVRVEDVESTVSVDAEHGDVTVSRVGPLTVSDTHGDVVVETVRGDLQARGQHTAVQATDVSGKADVETSFRDVSLERVGGDARVRTEHGTVKVTDVQGALDVEASFDEVTATRVHGPVKVVVVHGGMHGEGLDKGGYVRASGDEVVLEGVKGAFDIEADRGGVRIVPAGPVTEPLKVTTRHGGIELEVPAESRFDLKARADAGEVSADVPGLVATQTGAARVEAKIGGGGNEVLLSADHGDVRVRQGMAVASHREPGGVAPRAPDAPAATAK